MKELAMATLLVLAGYGLASAITRADLYDLGTCTYNVETGRPKMQDRILRQCPTNVWYSCQGGTHICCDTVDENGDLKTEALKLQ